MKCSLVALKESLEADGTYLMQIRLENGDVADLSFKPIDLRHFVKVAQSAMLERAATSGETFDVALVRLEGSGAGTNLFGPSVQVSTDQTGMISLIASDDQLRKLQQDTARALAMRAEKAAAN